MTALVAFGRDAAEAKKKKKKCKKSKVKCGKKCCAAGSVCAAGACAPGCMFTKTENDKLWTLQADCATTTTIEIEDEVTLDGNGKTITVAGSIKNFRGGAAVGRAPFATAVKLRNLTIDGAGLSGPCLDENQLDKSVGGVGFGIDTDVEIDSVTVKNLVCGVGIEVSALGATRRTITLTDVTVDNVTPCDNGFCGAITLVGNLDATITGSIVRQVGSDFAILVSANFGDVPSAAIDDLTVEDAFRGISAPGSQLTVQNSTLTDVTSGLIISGATGSLDITNSTIAGVAASGGLGIWYTFGASGAASGNTISNFACGINLSADAGDVTIGTNTFPNPPGNEQNVCDNRP